MPKIYPVILSGGSGSRLWPDSRSHYPKQLLPLISDKSMIQETVERVSGETGDFADPIIISNDTHRFIIAAQLAEIGINTDVHILEPFGRGTAAAAIVGALHVHEVDPNGLMLLLSADHHIVDIKAFHQAIEVAARAASMGFLTTFGIEPSGPETGFGYIKAGIETDASGAYEVERFEEKPTLENAKRMLKAGSHYWNGGMFLFSASMLLREAEEHCQDILKACRLSYGNAQKDLDFLRLEPEAFDACPSDTIDYAIMERTDKAAVVPSNIGWSDIGSWNALWEVGEKDENGNTTVGDVISINTHSSFLKSENILVATVGVKDLIVVQTKDAILVADKKEAQNVKDIVEVLKERSRPEFELHKRVHRPWGYYEGLDEGPHHQVKHICVKPGAALSLQYHHKRAEHWIVVNGTANVVVGDEEKVLNANESVYIPIEAKHRLSNDTKEPLHLIEVQTGTYLGEDDIVRLEDVYGRLEE
jgi:mannose-1-phosphate guanylyltransferase / mannose-6-phosphate isomerase